jgi:hypothetical protein
MKILYVRRACFTLLILLVSGCVSIPSEAPELSAELGNRISAIEDSNITLLHRFFDQKRKDVDRFIENEWVPTFANTFFSKPKISEAWETIVKEDDKNQRLMFIVKTGPKLQEMINKKRLELIQPLDDLERRIEKNIREEYSQARAINNSITSFLLSASKVAENRNRYLEMAEVTDDKVGNIIDKTDDAVSDLLKGAKDAQGKIDSAEKYLKKLRNIRDSI